MKDFWGNRPDQVGLPPGSWVGRGDATASVPGEDPHGFHGISREQAERNVAASTTPWGPVVCIIPPPIYVCISKNPSFFPLDFSLVLPSKEGLHNCKSLASSEAVCTIIWACTNKMPA